MEPSITRILGLDFYNGTVEGVIEQLKSGGLLVVPAAPGLAQIHDDQVYYNSLKAADLVIPDSGYMTLLWNLSHFPQRLKRISGLEFLVALFEDKEVRATANILLVDPRKEEVVSNLAFLRKQGFKMGKDSSYLAPMYSKHHVEDTELLQLIENKKPSYVIINLGGGVQEKLGAYLKRNLSYKPAIICTGAAIAFLTGKQAYIPTWADRLYLGWLCRCIEKPKLYVPRYLHAAKLLKVMLHFNNNDTALAQQ